MTTRSPMMKMTPIVPPMNLSMDRNSFERAGRPPVNSTPPDAFRKREAAALRSGVIGSVFAALLVCLAVEARADTSCRGGQSFDAWLTEFRRDAVRHVSAGAIAALDGIAFDDRVLRQDRGQPTLSQSFLDFAGRVVSADRLQRGRAMLQRYADTFSRIERDYGVPGPVIVAFWGLETDYGAYTGDFSSLRALATLAYDCRRPDHFRGELLDALKILDRGDMAPAAMKGAWAGELGQVQFTPSNYLRFAADYDGDGRRDLVGSVPDVLASTANYLKHLGWRTASPGWRRCASPTRFRGRNRRGPSNSRAPSGRRSA